MTETMNNLKTVESLDARIAQLKAELENVKGTTTEIYARIVGYYRPVRNWNKGKSQEYKERVMFESPASGSATLKAARIEKPAAVEESANGELGFTAGAEAAASYLFFYRNTCPNCPPVKAFIEELDIEGRAVNVDEDAGLSEAAAYQVYAAPTVLFFDTDGVEIFRASNATALEEFYAEAGAAVANA